MKRGRDHGDAKKSMAIRANASRGRLRHAAPHSQRARGLEKSERTQFAPPEDWYEPSESGTADYRVIMQDPGPGYVHVVTEAEIRARLAQLPSEVLKPLEVVQLSRMTRKKRCMPCYGMQWGPTLYLYPIEETLVEYFAIPPRPAQMVEAKMYGGRWEQEGNEWSLVWTMKCVKDFYLNNILMHELGHLLDDRNTSYLDRERYAEWFAIEHGFKKSRKTAQRQKRKRVRRRHHG